MMPRAERRQRARDVARRKAVILKQGFSPASLTPQVDFLDMAALAGLHLDRFAGRRNPAAASVLAAFAHKLVHPSLALVAGMDRQECAKGCGYCCHNWVSAPAPEVFRLAGGLRAAWGDDAALIAHLEASDAVTRGLDNEARYAAHYPCAVLRDNACGAYETRLTRCRTFGSLSRQACIDIFNGLSDDVPTPSGSYLLLAAFSTAMHTALYHGGYSSANYEINHALLVAVTTPDAEKRWLAGEDVFAGVQEDASGAAPLGSGLEGSVMEKTLIAVAHGTEPPPNPFGL
ncbi:MAG: hypothetical protein ACPGO3_00640 [Magnetospiraceae bacterium]